MGTLTGQTAVIMGASGEANFGAVIARRLAQEGASVVVSARREAPLAALAEEVGGLAVACDVTEETQIEALFSRAREHFGRVDMALYSAGTYAVGALAELSREAIQPSLEISFIGALLFFKHAAASMPDGGSVLTLSSLTARLPGPGLAVYAGARAGIDFAIEVAAHEYAEQGVRFNSLAPGLVETDMTDDLFAIPAIVEAHIRATPAGRMGTLDDVAEAALFLLDSGRSAYVNGQVLDLAGGQQTGRLPRF